MKYTTNLLIILQHNQEKHQTEHTIFSSENTDYDEI